jgi:hypothetical protein
LGRCKVLLERPGHVDASRDVNAPPSIAVLHAFFVAMPRMSGKCTVNSMHSAAFQRACGGACFFLHAKVELHNMVWNDLRAIVSSTRRGCSHDHEILLPVG